MTDIFNPFTPAAQKLILDGVRFAREAFAQLDPDLDGLKVSAANVSSYGRYVAKCCGNSSTISFAVDNGFSALERTASGLAPKGDGSALWGITVHEVGHAAVAQARNRKPAQGRSVGSSTHLKSDWMWVAAQGWTKHHNIKVTPVMIRNADKAARAALPSWQPNNPIPKEILEAEDTPLVMTVLCAHCGEPFVRKMTGASQGAKTCSTRCRVAMHRAKEAAQ